MILTQKELLLRIVDYLDSPEIKIEKSFREDYALSFYTIYLIFGGIRDELMLRKVLGFTHKRADVDEILMKKQLKLDDIFADYIGEDIVLSEVTRSKVEGVAANYRRILTTADSMREKRL